MEEDGKFMDSGELSVLLFHEEKSRLRHYLSLLRICGLRNIMAAECLSDAIQNIIATKVDLIIVVHIGKAAEASSLLEELNSLDALSSIPVVAIVADDGVRNALCVLEKGIRELLIEPLSRESVDNLLQEILLTQAVPNPAMERLEAAKAMVKREEFEQARAVFSDLLSSNPHPDIYLGLSQIDCALKQWPNAEANLRKAVKIAKSSNNRINVHRQLSNVFYHYGQYYEKRRQTDQAIKSYRTSLSLNPFCLQSVKALFKLLQMHDEIDEIVSLLKEVQANFLPFSQSLDEIVLCVNGLAEKFADLNMPVQTRRIYEELIKVQHRNVDVHLKLADFFLDLGRMSVAFKVLFNINKKVKDVDLSLKIGSLLLDIEKRFMSGGKLNTLEDVDLSFFQSVGSAQVIQMAQKIFQEALFMDPENVQLNLNSARCCLRSGESDAANAILERMKAIRKEDPDFLANMIEVLIEEEAYGLASVCLKEAVERFPDQVHFCRLYAEYYRKQGQFFDAVVSLKKGLLIQAEDPELTLKLAEAYVELKQYSDAILYFEKAEKLLPNDQSVQQGLQKALSMKYAKSGAAKKH